MVQMDFDANTVEPKSEFKPIPPGDYLAAITASIEKPTKLGTGSYLEIEFSVLDGEHKGRKVWSRLNLKNPSAVAVEIARGELSSICRSVGVMIPKDSCQLHCPPAPPLIISVDVVKRSDTGGMTNEIKGYYPRSRGVAQAAPAPPGTQQSAQTTSHTGPPAARPVAKNAPWAPPAAS